MGEGGRGGVPSSLCRVSSYEGSTSLYSVLLVDKFMIRLKRTGRMCHCQEIQYYCFINSIKKVNKIQNKERNKRGSFMHTSVLNQAESDLLGHI